ncbi:hypothetical protein BDV10DRAFT_155933 [Aspergillus recurvatus]
MKLELGSSISAVLDGYPPNFKPKTLEGLAVVEKYWQRYVRIFSDGRRDCKSLMYCRQICIHAKRNTWSIYSWRTKRST